MRHFLSNSKQIGQLVFTGIILLSLGFQLTPKASASDDYSLIESANHCYYGSYSTYVNGDC